jgi:hypothetical protein
MIKKQKLFKFAAIVTAIMIIAIVSIGVTSCSEGPMGPEGPQGPAGSNGTDGSDGSSGQDGSDGRPAIPVVVYNITYDTGQEGTAVDPQELMKGDKANRPGNAFRPFTQEQMLAEGAGLYRASTDNGWILLGWKMQDGSYYDFDEPVNADIHLTADWAMPGKIDTGGIGAVPADADFFDKALDYVIKEPASYFLVIDDDYTAESTKTATPVGISLTIVGIGSERTITSGTGTTNGTLFDINNGAQLHLENNITLKGKVTNSTQPLINITNGTLTMNDGSKITGHTTSNRTGTIYINGATSHFTMNGGEISGNQTINATYDASIISITNGAQFTLNSGTITGNTVAGGGCINLYTNEGSFTMNGGIITGNANTHASGAYPGGVYIQNVTLTGFRMSGGSITGNTGKMGDVYRAGINATPAASTNKNIIIFDEGDGHIGILTTVHHAAPAETTTAAQIKIAGRWTGSVQTLNLFYNDAAFGATLYNQYLNKYLVAGLVPYTLTGADIDNFKQVNFMKSDYVTQSAATVGYVLARAGANMGKIN